MTENHTIKVILPNNIKFKYTYNKNITTFNNLINEINKYYIINYKPRIIINYPLKEIINYNKNDLLINYIENNIIINIKESNNNSDNNNDNDNSDNTHQSSEKVKRIIIDADNSCLFNCIKYLLDLNNKNVEELRQIIIDIILSDPIKYNTSFLGKIPIEYCSWIQQSTSWGGEIECKIITIIIIICCLLFVIINFIYFFSKYI